MGVERWRLVGIVSVVSGVASTAVGLATIALVITHRVSLFASMVDIVNFLVLPIGALLAFLAGIAAVVGGLWADDARTAWFGFVGLVLGLVAAWAAYYLFDAAMHYY